MAQVDYFLKIDGIDGESTDDKHSKEIELESWSVGGTNSSSFSSGTGGGTVGKVALSDFHFVKKTDASSPKLFTHCCTGEHISKATLTCRKAGKDQQEFMTIVLTGAVVAAFQTTGSATTDTGPTDDVSLAFGKIEYKYKPQKPDGSLGGEIVGGWDVLANKAV